MKKIIFIFALAVSAFAGEISCDDMLRQADSKGVQIMPKTFDSIQGGNWVCHEEDGRFIAVARTEHHYLSIEGMSTDDRYVERLADGEREVSVKTDESGRSVSFLPFGNIEEMQAPYL